MANDFKDCPSPVFEIDQSGFVLINIPETNLASDETHTTITNDLNMAEVHTFPKELPDWSNLQVLHRNTLPPRASFFLFDNEADALTRDVAKAKALCL
jgi:beta-galactosidase